MASITDRFRSAWNAFTNNVPEDPAVLNPSRAPVFGGYTSTRPERSRPRMGTERTIISSIYTRMSIDICTVDIRHTRHDEDDRYLEDINSGLNECLKTEANIDQASLAFKQDIVLTLFQKGSAAIVAVDTTLDPTVTGGYDIKTMRVGEIVQWYPQHVRVSLYNERVGMRQEITLPKANVAIVENPLYDVMNEPNSTLQRLIRKLSLLDTTDEASSSGKLDLIIQLPYVVKTDEKRRQAEQRAKDIEFQLRSNQHGIAYTDGTEKITQLNRPVENNLLNQIELLINQLYIQLGITPEVMNGTADEATMINYANRTVEPILEAIVQAMRRAFLTKTARTQGQTVEYFRDPFKLIPMSQVAEIADKLTRNEILTSNEIRQKIGMKPAKDPKADKLINSNMPTGDTGVAIPGAGGTPPDPNAAAPPDLNAVPTQDPSITGAATPNALDSVNSAVEDAFRSFGATPPPAQDLAPPGELDPDVELQALDELDKGIDAAFAGLGVDNAAP